jgi:hypothetical protein
MSLLEFVIQCSCDWEAKIEDPDCVSCSVPECVTCDEVGLYESELGPVCLRCFIAPGPSLAELALLDSVEPAKLEEIPKSLRDALLG